MTPGVPQRRGRSSKEGSGPGLSAEIFELYRQRAEELHRAGWSGPLGAPRGISHIRLLFSDHRAVARDGTFDRKGCRATAARQLGEHRSGRPGRNRLLRQAAGRGLIAATASPAQEAHSRHRCSEDRQAGGLGYRRKRFPGQRERSVEGGRRSAANDVGPDAQPIGLKHRVARPFLQISNAWGKWRRNQRTHPTATGSRRR
jgi:hypothetical protein